MLENIFNLANTIAVVGALFAVIYQNLLTAKQHSNIKKRIEESLVRIQSVTHKDSLIASLLFVSDLLDKVYGKRNVDPSNDQSNIRSFFTIRAWHTSVLIVGCYLLIAPALSSLFFGLQNQIHSALASEASKVKNEAWLLMFFVIVWCLVVLFVARYFWKKREDAGRSVGGLNIFKDMIWISMTYGLAVLTILDLIPIEDTETTALKILNFFGLFSVIILSSVLTIWSLWKYSVLSPLFFLGAMAIAIFNFTTLKMSLAIVGFTSYPTILGPHEVNAFHLLIAIPISILMVLYVFKPARFREKVILILASFLYIFSLVFFSGGIGNLTIAPLASYIYWGSNVLMAVMFVLLIYTPILANSVPDTTSISFTRYCVWKAAHSSSAIKIASYLFIDLLLAVICILFSLSIFRLGAVVLEVSLYNFERLFGSVGNDAFVQMSFMVHRLIDYSYSIFFNVAGEFLGNRTLSSSWVSIDLPELGQIGGYKWPAALILGFALTGALPTILNACVLIYSIFTHVVFSILYSISERIHLLLTEVDEEGNLVGPSRVTWLLAALFSLAFSVLQFGIS